MEKKEFLARIEEKIEAVKIYQSSDMGDIDGLKEKIIPIIQKEFLESIPQLIKRGKKIKVQSNGFNLVGDLGGVYYIMIDKEQIKVGSWCDGLSILQKELCEELSFIVEREVRASTENNCLKFYFYW